jgi:hypothetical protein
MKHKKALTTSIIILISFMTFIVLFNAIFEKTTVFPTSTKLFMNNDKKIYKNIESEFSDKEMIDFKNFTLSLNIQSIDDFQEDFDITIFTVNESICIIQQWSSNEIRKNGWTFKKAMNKTTDEYRVNTLFYMKGLIGKAIFIADGNMISNIFNHDTLVIIAIAPFWVFNEYEGLYNDFQGQ